MRLFPNHPQFRFLLRSCGLLIGMLILWWIFLLEPLLGWVRISGDFILALVPGAADGAHVTVKPDGNWMLRVPVPAEAATRADLQKLAGGSAQPKKVRSIQMETSRDKVALFTVALPLYWAFVLAAPGKNLIRILAYGSGAIAAMMPFMLMVHAMATVRTYFHISSAPLAGFLWSSAGYLDTEVLPYAAPLFLSLWLNAELRTQMFSWVPAAEPRQDSQLTRRERKRQRRRDARAS